MSILESVKSMGIQHNVTIRVLDAFTHKVISEHIGHNQATNTLLTGIAHYLKGDGILNQGSYMLGNYIPRYISLGTMGLYSQECDEQGLPIGIGPSGDISEEERFEIYMKQTPGYGADGYDFNKNNGRNTLGLGPVYSGSNIGCELISKSFPRAEISYREVIPEIKAELPETIDVVYSAMISTGALAQFRDKVETTNDYDGSNFNESCTCGCEKCMHSNNLNISNKKKQDVGYIFITEAGLWSRSDWTNSRSNGLLAGYRIIPPDEKNWDMTKPENRELLKRQIIKVNRNQVVQVIWKIQLISKKI